MTSDCPTFIRFGSSLGFAARSASNLNPYLRAMRVGVSPALTVCVRGLADRLGERPELLEPADRVPSVAVDPGVAANLAPGSGTGAFVTDCRRVA